MLCKNIKATFFLSHEICFDNDEFLSCLKDKKITFTKKKSLYTIKHSDFRFVCTIYFKKLSEIHITGIINKNIFKYIIFFLEKYISIPLRIRVDNSMFAGKLESPICDFKLAKLNLKFNNIYTCNYTEEIFPALFLKPKNKINNNPTILLFKTGSYIILGGKTLAKVKYAQSFLKSMCLY